METKGDNIERADAGGIRRGKTKAKIKRADAESYTDQRPAEE